MRVETSKIASMLNVMELVVPSDLSLNRLSLLGQSDHLLHLSEVS